MEFKEATRTPNQYLGTVTFVPTAEDGYFNTPDLPHRFERLTVFDVHPQHAMEFEWDDFSNVGWYVDPIDDEGTFTIHTYGMLRKGFTAATVRKGVVREIPHKSPILAENKSTELTVPSY